MFEAIELRHRMSKEAFKEQEPALRTALLGLQKKLMQARVATVILVGGVEGAGKGEVVNRLNKWLDTRAIETHAFWDETDEESERPWMWRFWRRLPPRGTIAILFGGWYWRPLYRHVRGDFSDADLDAALRQVVEMEKMLQQDGMLIIKLWYHLSKEEYNLRRKKNQALEKLLPRKLRRKKDSYRKFIRSAERVIHNSNHVENPWYLIEADDRSYRDLTTGQTLRECMEARLQQHRQFERRTPDSQASTVLDQMDLSLRLGPAEYDKQLQHYQEKLYELTWRAYDRGLSTVILMEGWDAAGKGGTIRRITEGVDARLYRVIETTAPTDEEKAHHYLWRFWRHIPRAGYMTLYDRSWYGRVLVERVEGFARPPEWQRSYQEINDFEEQLQAHGVLLLKFWLHISDAEQLQRFQARSETEWKQYKLTDDDWRNRAKRDAYQHAVNDMVLHTSTTQCPWRLVPANDKPFARIEVLKQVCVALQNAIEQ